MREASELQVRHLDGTGRRAVAGLLAALCLALLVLAASLSPAAEGHGTHTQLGLPACGWAVRLGVPCATCGMTTAFAHAADGSVLTALATQPFGLAMAVGTAVAFWVFLHAAATNSRAWLVFGTMRRPIVLVGVAALAGAAWAYKIAVWP